MKINYEKAMRTFLIIGLVLFGIGISTPYPSFYIGTGAFWILALFCFWRYRKE